MITNLRVLALLAVASCSTPARKVEPAGEPATKTAADALEDSRPPNIVFLYADDHAQNALGAYGSTFVRTPNLDRLAAEGVRFANSFVGNSICAPARATVLTGLHSHANGVIDNGAVFDGSQDTFPKRLQAAGYQTAMIGKWHLKSDPTGFDHWEVLIGQGPYYNPTLHTAHGDQQVEGYTTEVITDRALDWLESGRDEERPFLMMMQHKAPHRHWMPGPKRLGALTEREIPEPPTLFDDWSGRASPASEQEMTIDRHLSEHDLKLAEQGGLTDEQRALWDASYDPRNEAFRASGLEGDDLLRWKYRRYLEDYLACVEAIDDSVGQVLAWLEQEGLAENTLVVYSSDQGFYLGEHGWYDKRWMYEESLSTPLIARWPGTIEAGRVERHLVQNIDLAPTFLAAAGQEVPEAMHGESLIPLLRGEHPRDWRRSIYYRYYEYPQPHRVAPHRGVRTERYKLMVFEDRDEWELFDLEKDPHELDSLHDDPDSAELAAELRAELARLAEHYEDDPAG